LAAAASSVLIFGVTAVSCLMVLLQMGLYAAIIWFPFPVGSLSFIKARFCPLEAKHSNLGSGSGSAV